MILDANSESDWGQIVTVEGGVFNYITSAHKLYVGITGFYYSAQLFESKQYDFDISPGQVVDLGVINLKPLNPGSLSGEVTLNGVTRLEGAKITLVPDGDGVLLPTNRQATVGTDGTFSLVNVVPGQYMMRVDLTTIINADNYTQPITQIQVFCTNDGQGPVLEYTWDQNALAYILWDKPVIIEKDTSHSIIMNFQG